MGDLNHLNTPVHILLTAMNLVYYVDQMVPKVVNDVVE